MWKKSKLAGMVTAPPENETSPSVAPVGLPQPAMASRQMGHDLKPMAIPHQMPAAPQLKAQPDMAINDAARKKALFNIARGVKGF